jgi:hypothetical protein
MTAFETKIAAKVATQQKMLKRQGLINALKLRVQETDSVQAKNVEATIADIKATAEAQVRLMCISTFFIALVCEISFLFYQALWKG